LLEEDQEEAESAAEAAEADCYFHIVIRVQLD
jgi:hypothetical protein